MTCRYDTRTSQFSYGGKRHYHLDHLGSVRVVDNQGGRAISENDLYPFGQAITLHYQEQINHGNPHTDGMRFAGHWRDFMGYPPSRTTPTSTTCTITTLILTWGGSCPSIR